ncbi:phage repressor protein C with HTH and peptisase S24 domain [Sphingomonas kyeonggiensis]|uniref:S24 family peptidase n=1 Tax=Sphingomonas kyeonggiensis TaxID=1268553 RepID=UPI00277D858B|nr:S24 family peptidase [Sphingomonas kyeonggiensis]MDQ0251779.1 phage repressor protein C with HTH and peptisase S24 domain [Sphingomonas kyeonggiensis]
MEPDAQRAALEALIAENGTSLSELSRLLGRNAAYLQQYLVRGTPRLLSEADRALLARYFGVAEARLGGPEQEGLVEVARLDVGASAGPGGLVEGEARRRRGAQFSPELLRALGVRPEAASMIRVRGDSMVPTLEDGDEILVDRDRRRVEGRGGVFVIRLDGELMVKRLRIGVGGIEVISDNPEWETRVVPTRALDVVGRVAWLGRAV